MSSDWWMYLIPGVREYKITQDVKKGVYNVATGRDWDGTTQEEKTTGEALTELKNNKPEDYTSTDEYKQRKSQIEAAQKEYDDLNNKGFTYDYTKDQAYKQYKDQYTQGAKLANENAQATAAARSGGYANSWAASSGQTAYQNTMSGLKSAANSLYNQAYSEYNTQKSDASNKVNALQQQESLAQSAYNTKTNNYYNDLNSAQSDYATAVSNRQTLDNQYTTTDAALTGAGLKLLMYLL